MTKPAISIQGVSKTYRRGVTRRRDIRSSLNAWWSEFGKTKEEFYALKNITLEIPEGAVMGIVGPNGAGKSTLLKLLSRITYPTAGRIAIHGSLSSMLEVGTGFHPELTGRENIYLNGAIIGMRREEVSRKLDSIIEFSGIEPFIDTPVKHYSSGMYVRLAFSVASHLEPDIMLIDEVLAVGDQAFRNKCMERMLDVSGKGRTLIVVSHQMTYLKELCTSGIYLDRGEIVYLGKMEDTIQQYINRYSSPRNDAVQLRDDRRGSGVVRVTSMAVMDEKGYPAPMLAAGRPALIELELATTQPEVHNIAVQLEWYDVYGQLWFIADNSVSNSSIAQIHGKHKVRCLIPKLPLNAGIYHLNVLVKTGHGRQMSDELLNAYTVEVEPGPFYTTGKLPPASKGFLAEYTWEDM